MANESKNKLVNEDGSYEVSPLEKDVITLKVIQTGVNLLQEYDDPKVGLKDNLNHMILILLATKTQSPILFFIMNSRSRVIRQVPEQKN